MTLFDFYSALAERLDMLDAKFEHGVIEATEVDERERLEDFFEAEAEPAVTLLTQLEAMLYRSSSGDSVVDDWDDALDRGEVPAEFWGPDGPPPKTQAEPVNG